LKDRDELALLPPLSSGFEESGRYAG
jgi:hypothetical protein